MRGQERREEPGGDGARPHPCDGNYYRHVRDTLLRVPGPRSYLAQGCWWVRAASRQPSIPHCLLHGWGIAFPATACILKSHVYAFALAFFPAVVFPVQLYKCPPQSPRTRTFLQRFPCCKLASRALHVVSFIMWFQVTLKIPVLKDNFFKIWSISLHLYFIVKILVFLLGLILRCLLRDHNLKARIQVKPGDSPYLVTCSDVLQNKASNFYFYRGNLNFWVPFQSQV